MTLKDLSFVGLWKAEDTDGGPMLLRVMDYKLGWGMYDSKDAANKLQIRAAIVKHVEGMRMPRRFKIVLPDRRYVLRMDSCFEISRGGEWPVVELVGAVYGNHPLKPEPMDEPLKKFMEGTLGEVYSPQDASRWKRWSRGIAPLHVPEPWKETAGVSGGLRLSDTSVINAPWMPEDKFAIVTPQIIRDLTTIMSVNEVRELLHLEPLK